MCLPLLQGSYVACLFEFSVMFHSPVAWEIISDSRSSTEVTSDCQGKSGVVSIHML